jgi:hypothetical protein
VKVFVLALLLGLSTTARAEPALEVTAKVIEMPKKIIYCGILAFRAVVRYQVITVDRGATSAKELFVVELCPESLKVGLTRKLRLRPTRKTDSFFDDFTPGPRWISRT